MENVYRNNDLTEDQKKEIELAEVTAKLNQQMMQEEEARHYAEAKEAERLAEEKAAQEARIQQEEWLNSDIPAAVVFENLGRHSEWSDQKKEAFISRFGTTSCTNKEFAEWQKQYAHDTRFAELLSKTMAAPTVKNFSELMCVFLLTSDGKYFTKAIKESK